MASTIQIKRGTGSAVPSGLADGELAINLDDGKFYFGSASVSVSDFKFNTLTVNELTSSIITSSIVRSSGSNIFGDEAADTHTFVGNITASGNISSSGDIIGNEITASGNIEALGLTFSNGGDRSLTGPLNEDLIINARPNNTTEGLHLQIGGTDKLFINQNGDVGIGNSSPGKELDVTGEIRASGNITANGNIVGDNNTSLTGIKDITTVGVITTTNITASGDISASGNISATGDLDIDGKSHFTGNITASGNISASGDIISGLTSKLITPTIKTIVNSNDSFVITDNNDQPFIHYKSSMEDADSILTLGDKESSGNGTQLLIDDENNRVVLNSAHLDITSTIDATNASGDTGVLRVEGGASIAKKVFIGTDLNIGGSITSNITASGNISASGTVTAESLNIKGNTILGDNNGGDLIAISGSIQLTGSNGIKIVSDLPGLDPSTPVGIFAPTPGNMAFVGDGSTNIENINAINARSISSDASSGQGITLGFDNSGGAGSFISLKAATGHDVIVESSLLISGSTPHITASGNISASGTVTANSIVGTLATAAQTNITSLGTLTTLTVDDITINSSTISDSNDLTLDAGDDITLDTEGDIRFKDDGTLRYTFKVDSTPEIDIVGDLIIDPSGGNVKFSGANINVEGHITASGNISSSGTIFTDEISSPTNNLIVSSSTVRLTATTNGEANLILEADSDNNDENDNPFMDFLQDGGGVAGQIGISGDADKWPDGDALTGTSGNSMVIGMKGAASTTNRQLFFVTADTVALKLDNGQSAHFTNHITASGNISASGNIIGSEAHITTIQSQDSVGVLELKGDNKGSVLKINSTNDTGNRVVGLEMSASGDGHVFSLGLGRGNVDGVGTFVIAPTVVSTAEANAVFEMSTTGNITSSGAISSSATVQADTGSFNSLTKAYTFLPFYYYVSSTHTSELYVPLVGGQVESTSDQYYHYFHAPYNGRINRVSLSWQTGDPGDTTIRIRKDNSTPFDPDDSDDIVETVVLSSAVDDTMYHVDFSSSYSKGDVVCLTVQQTGTTNSYVVGTVAMEFDPTS